MNRTFFVEKRYYIMITTVPHEKRTRVYPSRRNEFNRTSFLMHDVMLEFGNYAALCGAIVSLLPSHKRRKRPPSAVDVGT